MKKEVYVESRLSNATISDIVSEDKLLIYNGQSIVLFKTRDGENFIIPTRVGEKSAFYDLIFQEIIKSPVIELYQRTSFRSSPSEECIQTIKHYFATYLEMTLDEQSCIVQLADKFGLDPYMIPFKDVYAVNSSEFFDKGAPIAVKEIERKIYYKGYFDEARKNAALLARK